MALLFYVSKAFSKRFSSDVSKMPESLSHDLRPNAWSLHCFNLGRSPFVMVMNDRSLWPILIPVTGIKTMSKFLSLLLPQIEKSWGTFGRDFDSGNVSIVQFSRSNRSLIGSMNDAIKMLNYAYDDARFAKTTPDWERAVSHLRKMPYSALPESFPYRAMEVIASKSNLPLS